MGIDLNRHLTETATKVAITENEYGDKIYGSTTTVRCLYRDITRLEANQNRSEVNPDGHLYFAADADVSRDDIFYHPDEGYLKIEKITRAKRLVVDQTTQFIKCEVLKQRQVS